MSKDFHSFEGGLNLVQHARDSLKISDQLVTEAIMTIVDKRVKERELQKAIPVLTLKQIKAQNLSVANILCTKPDHLKQPDPGDKEPVVTVPPTRKVKINYKAPVVP